MIRRATKDDVEAIRDLIVQDVHSRKWEEMSGIETDKYTIDSIIRYHVRHRDAVAMVAEHEGKVVGYLIGALQPYLLDIRHHAAHEKMSGGEHVSDLWGEFSKWAKERQAPVMVLSCYNQSESGRFRKVE